MLPFWLSIAVLSLAQAAIAALPASRPLPALDRLRRPLWAAVPVLSVAGVAFAIRAAAGTAEALTYLALIAVPILAAVALGGFIRGAQPRLASLAVAVFALAWADRGGLAGESAGLVLDALSCVTLGWLLASVAPARWLKVGVVAMAAIDTALVVADLLQAPNAVLIAAHPVAGLPQLQRVAFGSAVLGYGDLFVAGVVGALFAATPRRQRLVAVIAGGLGLLSDLLFFAVRELPATVPIAAAMILAEVLHGRLPAEGRGQAQRTASTSTCSSS